MTELDPRGLRGDAPLLDAYLNVLDSERTPFTVPGHKGRTDLVGAVVAGDVPMYSGVDTARLDGGWLAAAESRAAALWGVDWCRFSVGGSTHGNQALALGVAPAGSAVIVSRTLHRSMLSGLILAGLDPVWVQPWLDPASGLPGGVPAEAVAAAFASRPDACAVFVGDPSYAGGIGDVAALAEVAHANDAPLIVDSAWAAHFGFHPDLPRHALAQGADAMVTSAHKTLPAISQAALVLADTRSGRIDAARLQRAFEATHTTSPAGAILASIDAARALLERDGAELIDRLLRIVADVRERLRAIDGVDVVSGPWFDPSKVAMVLDGRGPSGDAIDRFLLDRGMAIEMTDRTTVIPMFTLADDEQCAERFVAGMEAAHRELPPAGRRGTASDPADRAKTIWALRPDIVMAPRDAFFAPHETVPITHAIGRVSAELMAPYPPGIPVLAPGERITAEALATMLGARDDNTRIAYAADSTLQTLQVVRAVV